MCSRFLSKLNLRQATQKLKSWPYVIKCTVCFFKIEAICFLVSAWFIITWVKFFCSKIIFLGLLFNNFRRFVTAYVLLSLLILIVFILRVRPQIPVLKEAEPLLEFDRDERKFDIFLTYHRSSLLVSDLKIFLPFTINLDPYIKKVIKGEIIINFHISNWR